MKPTSAPPNKRMQLAAPVNPEILLVDEVLGAGDQSFVAKAEKRIKNIISASKIFVLATHNDSIMKDLCNKVMLLDHGIVVDYGDTDKVIDTYHKNIS